MCHVPLLRKLLKDILYQNEGGNQERKDVNTSIRNATQERSKRMTMESGQPRLEQEGRFCSGKILP